VKPRIVQIIRRPRTQVAKCRCGEVAKFITVISSSVKGNDDEAFLSCGTHKRAVLFLTSWE